MRVWFIQDSGLLRVRFIQDSGLLTVWFIQDSGLFRVWFIQDSGLFRVWFKLVSLYVCLLVIYINTIHVFFFRGVLSLWLYSLLVAIRQQYYLL